MHYAHVGRNFSKLPEPEPNPHNCKAFKELINLIRPKTTATNSTVETKASAAEKSPAAKGSPAKLLLPFGALDLATLQEGKKLLENIAKGIKSERKRTRSGYTSALTKLTTDYFSLIPQKLSPGKAFPWLFQNAAACDTEVTKIDGWIADYPNAMLTSLNPPIPVVHECQAHLDTLGLEALDDLGIDTTEYKEIHNYFHGTSEFNQKYDEFDGRRHSKYRRPSPPGHSY